MNNISKEIINNALFTDFYELTMAQGYWKENMNQKYISDAELKVSKPKQIISDKMITEIMSSLLLTDISIFKLYKELREKIFLGVQFCLDFYTETKKEIRKECDTDAKIRQINNKRTLRKIIRYLGGKCIDLGDIKDFEKQDPERYEEIVKDIKCLIQLFDHWTDNVYIIEQWFRNKSPGTNSVDIIFK